MGTTQATEFAALVNDGAISLRTAMHYHLSSNHFPPVPTSMVDPCIAAIEAAVDGDWAREIELPEGVSWRGHSWASAAALVEDHHLGFFVEAELYGDEEL